MPIVFDLPDTQISFASALAEIRSLYLQDALSATVSALDISELDTELHRFVNNDSLRILASHGMRGELLFATPFILRADPRLLGYYRLLLGYSKKGFYTADTGAAVFKSMEDRGTLSSKQEPFLEELCIALNADAQYFLDRLSPSMIAAGFFDQLTLLTLGPQLRGGANVQKGTSAISQVFDVVFQIVKNRVQYADKHKITLTNNSGRTVLIQFAADPDIVIREELQPEVYKNLIAIEVKGGQDYSNIHNRVGEAEKSHQKARKDGYVECWTVVNVDRIDLSMARKESPSTNRFYRLSELLSGTSYEYNDFSLQIQSAAGI